VSHSLFDEDGLIKGFSYHDGKLDGVLIDGVGDVHLGIRAVSGEQRLLSLHQVRGLCIQGFRQGNIILSVRVLEFSRALRDAELASQIAERLFLDATSATGEQVFCLDSSYGADIIAVCGRIDVSEIGGCLAVCT